MNCEECKERLYPEDPEVGYCNPHTKRYLTPLCQGCSNAYQKEDDEVADRVSNLEAISAQAGRIPREYHRRLQQLQGQTIFLQNKVYELVEGKQRVKKPGYQGLKVGGNGS